MRKLKKKKKIENKTCLNYSISFHVIKESELSLVTSLT